MSQREDSRSTQQDDCSFCEWLFTLAITIILGLIGFILHEDKITNFLQNRKKSTVAKKTNRWAGETPADFVETPVQPPAILTPIKEIYIDWRIAVGAVSIIFVLVYVVISAGIESYLLKERLLSQTPFQEIILYEGDSDTLTETEVLIPGGDTLKCYLLSQPTKPPRRGQFHIVLRECWHTMASFPSQEVEALLRRHEAEEIGLAAGMLPNDFNAAVSTYTQVTTTDGIIIYCLIYPGIHAREGLVNSRTCWTKE